MKLLYNGSLGATAEPGIIAFEAVRKVFDHCGIKSPPKVIYNAATVERSKKSMLAKSFYLEDRETGEVLIIVENDQIIFIKDKMEELQ